MKVEKEVIIEIEQKQNTLVNKSNEKTEIKEAKMNENIVNWLNNTEEKKEDNEKEKLVNKNSFDKNELKIELLILSYLFILLKMK